MKRIQVVLRLYRSPAEILMGFDVDSCTAGFDGSRVWMTSRCARSLIERCNYVDTSRRSTSYEYRLYKYSKRGFAVKVEGVDHALVRPELLSPPIEDGKLVWNKRESGLALLMLLDGAQRGYDEYARRGGVYHPRYGPVTKDDNDNDWEDSEDSEEGPYYSDEDDPVTDFMAEMTPSPEKKKKENISDYANVRIPFGPRWKRLSKLERFLNWFVYSAAMYWRPILYPGEMEVGDCQTWTRALDPTRDITPVAVGTLSKVLRTTVRKVVTAQDDKGTFAVKEWTPESMWLRDNPGTQAQLTGSFNPIQDDPANWYESAYVRLATVSNPRGELPAMEAREERKKSDVVLS
ncbi:hypothetical protein HDU93_007102 [Gonapodya sp. JEL0774]|nr:hypothetical protein HDU93_007102 [Gonapodya sp. JEL0774]